MPTFLEVTIDNKIVEIKFNAVATHPRVMSNGTAFLRERVLFIRKSLNPCLDVYIEGMGEFQINLTGEGGALPIETVNSLVPTDLDDLYTKIKTYMNL